jgi:hypothetical protein
LQPHEGALTGARVGVDPPGRAPHQAEGIGGVTGVPGVHGQVGQRIGESGVAAVGVLTREYRLRRMASLREVAGSQQS